MRELGEISIGYPAWIRTKNNASKGRCVTTDTSFKVRVTHFLEQLVALLPRLNT